MTERSEGTRPWRVTREWKAALLSLLGGPGMGQLYNRDWRKGWILIAVTLVMLGWVMVILFQSVSAALRDGTATPERMERVKAEATRLMTPRLKSGIPAWTVLWVYGVLDAWFVGRRQDA